VRLTRELVCGAGQARTRIGNELGLIEQGKKAGKQSKGRVTPKGKPSLQLPSFDPDAMPTLEDLQGDGLPGLR
jgi:hypothetical protein